MQVSRSRRPGGSSPSNHEGLERATFGVSMLTRRSIASGAPRSSRPGALRSSERARSCDGAFVRAAGLRGSARHVRPVSLTGSRPSRAARRCVRAWFHPRGAALLSEVGFRLAGAENPLILVPTHVNGRGPYEFILDTGAGMSLLAPRLAGELGIVSSGAREGRGAGGRVQLAITRVESLAIGEARSGGMPVGITADVDRIA